MKIRCMTRARYWSRCFAGKFSGSQNTAVSHGSCDVHHRRAAFVSRGHTGVTRRSLDNKLITDGRTAGDTSSRYYGRSAYAARDCCRRVVNERRKIDAEICMCAIYIDCTMQSGHLCIACVCGLVALVANQRLVQSLICTAVGGLDRCSL